MHNKKRNQKR